MDPSLPLGPWLPLDLWLLLIPSDLSLRLHLLIPWLRLGRSLRWLPLLRLGRLLQWLPLLRLDLRLQ